MVSPSAAEPSPRPHAAPTPAHVQEALRLEQALNRLNEPDRQLITLRNRLRLSFEEIGVRLNCDGYEACLRWFRAIEQLAQQLEQP